MNEAWRDIEGYEGRYQISTFGRLRPCRDKRRILAQAKHYKGHLFIILRSAGKKRKHFIHRLVALAFLPRIEGKDLVNHKDGDKRNNILDNLEWCTVKENTIHYYQQIRPRKELDKEHAVK